MGLLDNLGNAVLPIGGQIAGGLLQSIFSGSKKRQRELENLTSQSPIYNGGSSIRDYYNKSLQRYNVNPYTGTLYQTSLQNAQRATNQGLSALQDRRSALSGVGKLVAMQNDANLKAGIAAENEQARRFSQLGSAASANAAEDKYQYQQNQLAPYLRRLQNAQQKAGGAAAVKSAGLQNIFGALTNASYLLGNKSKDGNTNVNDAMKNIYAAQGAAQMAKLPNFFGKPQPSVYDNLPLNANTEQEETPIDLTFSPFSERRYGKK